ncbi:hypothetical protein SNE40_014744 [Patella caerulea]|uniref:Cysteine and tyrosine-rich protein 1 n=1 Tax=Patella caerulea TaxID=87958 RepID=A0AAN8PHV3_PATCE
MLSKVFLFVIFSHISVSFCGEYCQNYDTYVYISTYKYCDDGCCGRTYNDETPCCVPSNGGAVAGGVITTLIVIGIICFVIFRVKYRSNRVTVVSSSAPSTSVTVATTHQATSQAPQYYPPPPVQPQYHQPGQPSYPPPYSTGTSHSYSTKTQYM